MKCQQVQLWLLEAKPTTSLPSAIERHLSGCPECQRRQRQLERLEERVREMPLPPSNPAVKERLWERLDQVPRSTLQPFPRPRSWVVRRILATAIAASLLVGLGWTLGHYGVSRPGLIPPNEKAPVGGDGSPAARAGGRQIAPRIAMHDVRLAAAPTTGEQLDALASMADDLRTEAIRLTRQGAWDEVALVADLYDRVVRRGLAGRVKSLSADERAALVPPLVRQLRATETEVGAVSANILPAAADLLRPIARAAQDGSANFQSGQGAAEVAPAPVPMGGPEPFLKVLVLSGLQLAEETDPLQRADLSSTLAQRLAQAIVLLSAGGDADQAAELGSALGSLMDRGVSENLVRVETADLPESRRAEVEKVRKRSARAMAVLERNLSGAPPAARMGLQRALQASGIGGDQAKQRGKGKSKGKGKGQGGNTGPPWLRDEKEDKSGPPHGKPLTPQMKGKGTGGSIPKSKAEPER